MALTSHIFNGQFEITTNIPDFVSYLHYDNKMPVVDRFNIRSLDGKTHTDVSMTVRLTSTETDFAEVLVLQFPEVTPGGADETVNLKLIPNLFYSITANRTAELEIEVLKGDASLGNFSATTELYPLNSWKQGVGTRLDSLLIAAFSQPGDPEIPKILTRARAIKETLSAHYGGTYSPDTKGYQGDPEEVVAEALSIYEAIREAEINYSNPLPNFNLYGQPIRTPSEIFRDKSATCLDSAMLMASCLEAIKVHPTVILVPGHAFVGVWTASDRQPEVVTDLLEIAGLVKAGLLVLIETTTLCRGATNLAFADATRANVHWLDSSYKPDLKPGQEDIRQSVSIIRARIIDKVRPLPSLAKDDSGNTIVIQAELPKVEFNFTGTTDAPKLSLRDDDSPLRVKLWKTSLLDLTFNNPLLNRSRRSGSSAKLVVPNGKLASIEDKLQVGEKLNLVPFSRLDNDGNEIVFEVPRYGSLDEESNEFATKFLVMDSALGVSATRKQFSATLRKLANSSKASRQETGVNNLFMTFGSLTWDKDPESPSAGQVTSPLFLLPVTLTHLGKDNFEVLLDDTSEPAPNETLALKLAEIQVNVPLLSNPNADAAGFDIRGLIDHVREQVNVVHKKTNWIVDEDATIGTFDFSNFHMWKDLQDNWKVLAEAPLVKHLLETDGTNPYLDPKATNAQATPEELDAEIAKLPIASDETQVRAVLKSLTGESFIIQGPPGTGKSQTITNLLARNLQEGKRVLFMSEKPAALAVVKDRLDEIGLGDFILDLHDKGTKPANIRNQLLASMDAKPEIDKTGLDAASADYDTALRTLAKYPEQVHGTDEKYGESVYSARERLLEIGGTERVALDRSFVSAMPKAAFDVFLGAMRDLPQVGQVAKTYATNPWSLSNLQDSEISLELKDTVKAIAAKIHNLAESIQADESLKRLMAQVDDVAAVRQYVSFTNVSLPAPAELAGARAAESAMHRKRLKGELAKLENEAKSNEHFSPNMASLNFAELQSKLEQAEQAKLFKGKKLTAVAEQLNNYLAKPVFKENVSFVFASLKLLASQAQEVEALAKQSLGLGDVSDFKAFELESYSYLAKQIEDLESLLALTDSSVNQSADLILQLINAGKGDHLARLGELGREFEALAVLLKSTDDSQAKWCGEKNLGERLIECASAWRDGTLDGDPKELSRWARVLDLLKPLRDLNQFEAIDQILSGKVSYSDAPRAIERTYFGLLFEKLLDDNEIANFEGTTQDSRVQQLDQAAKRLKEYNQGFVASQVVAGRKFDASSNVGVTGALRAELTKQRKQAPVRKLLRQYWPTITQVTPIVAASPDSVARFLDIETAKFDLVVFDEASQIRVATAIGALGRAPQAIIVGDSNQMPPTAMFTKADGSGDLELVEEDNFGLNDQESILSMTEIAQIPSVMLSWHYRSQDEILIAFSNKYIYEGKLSSFPSPRTGQLPVEQRKLRLLDDVSNLYVSSAKRKAADAEDAEAGDELEGRFNTNLAEAKRVVAEVKKYVKAAGAKPLSLGIITMNEQQRELIERLLDTLDDENIRRLRNNEIFPRDYLFVRALEKVQGDERDVILLSVGFGRTTEKGKLNLTFGPLIRANSHRRLNVAVTRARKEMAVFTSFDPSEMLLSENSSRGMKLLKKFLEFAQGSEQISVSSANASTLRDRHREDIANALEAEGIHVTQNLGLSNFRVDIAVADPRDPTRCILAIMLDSRGWKSRSSSADRELLPAAVLKANMKWPSVERIWLPMWLRDRDGEIARIKQAIEVAVTESEMKAEAREDAAREEVEASATDAAAITGLINLSDVLSTAEEKPEKLAGEPQAKASKTVTLGVNIDEIEHFKILRDQMLVPDKTYIQYLDHPKIQELLLDITGQLTNMEGPVSPTRLVQFVAKCFGLTGVKSARAEEILAAVSSKVHKRDAEGFIYPKDVAPDAFSSWAKQNPGIGRSLQDISLVEISNAMVTLCSKTAGMESAELAKQTSLAFGTGKLTKLADKRMYDAEQVGIRRGVLVNHDGITMAAHS